jgi:hypothetical protein
MRVSPAAVVIVALAVAVLAVVAGLTLIDPPRPLVVSAGFDRDAITPNADGDQDVATFAFELARPAFVTLTLSDDAARYVIRQSQRTPSGEHALAFSGVVDGYVFEGEEVESSVERRLIPNGNYTWSFEALGVDGEESGSRSGSLSVDEADSDLPLLTEFSVSPTVFTPNQDAISDRVAINAYLHKEADVTGYLIGPDGERVYLPPRELDNRMGEVGWQEFDYAGGVDIGADPPPDGEYTVVIEAQDSAGQRVSIAGELAIERGGKPRAGIFVQGSGADVVFTTAPYDDAYFSDIDGLGAPVPRPDDPNDARLGQVVVPVGDLLVFMLVVENYGSSPIRTDGPPPGTVFQQRQPAAALYQASQDEQGIGAIEQDGVWRVGIQCETSEDFYPYRWAVGAFDTLNRVEDEASDNTYYYLEPGQRSVVWGGVRLTNAFRASNPQQCWAGLIHEGVGVINNRIGARDILIADPGVE